jgi:hypothetical protein
MADAKEKFSAQADPEILQSVRELARKEGRQFQSLIDEAFRDLLEKRKTTRPRQHVLDHYRASLEQYDNLYKKLAE